MILDNGLEGAPAALCSPCTLNLVPWVSKAPIKFWWER